jgi:PAS domain S-box-containing protein
MAQHIRILMLEDNPHDAELIQRELRRAGLDFSGPCVDAESDFRAALESTDPDVILADYNLRGFDGVSGLKIAKSLVPETPFIFVSGSIGEERAVQTLREGATDYILKDRLSRLPAAITRALDQRRERQLRRRAQDALQRSEQRFQYAAKATQEVIWDHDVATRKVTFNEALKTVWGYQLDAPEVDFTWWQSRIHPHDRQRTISSLNKALESEERWSGAYRFQRADGTYGHVVDRAVIIRDPGGEATRLIRAMVDMTDRVAAEETIRRLSRQNEMILEYAAEAIYAMSSDGKMLTVNPATAKLTSFSLEEIRATTNVHELIHHSRPDGSPYPFADCPMHKTMIDGVVRMGEEVFWRKSREPFPVDYSCSPIHENDSITGCVVMFQDITERKRLERQVETAHRVTSLGRVAATIAHEFNNVLMGIQPFAEVIRRAAVNEEKVQKAANQIISSVGRGKRVTQEILRFTQPAEPAFQPVVLADWLQQLIPELSAMIGQRIEIGIDAVPRPVTARCDPAQLQQVLTNLVLNARDAMPSGGKISLILSDHRDQRQFPFGTVPKGMVLLAVRDNGSGMIPEVRQSIFEPLFTTKRSGTGLGLAVAQQVIDRHRGAIHVESAPGQGTTFFILLQAATEAAAKSVEKRQQTTSVQRILLVEDEPIVASGIAALLEGEGIEVRTVERGGDAPDAAESFRPDVVILDLSLPDMNGLDVYVALKTISPDLPIIFSSGHGDQAALEQQIDSSTVAFLRKPYELEALLETLQKVIANRGQGVKR